MKSTQTLPTVEPVDQELVDALAAHRALEADREATVTEHRRLLAIINPGPDDPARDGLDVLDAREALPAAASARNRAEALVRRSHRRVEAAQAAVRAQAEAALRERLRPLVLARSTYRAEAAAFEQPILEAIAEAANTHGVHAFDGVIDPTTAWRDSHEAAMSRLLTPPAPPGPPPGSVLVRALKSFGIWQNGMLDPAVANAGAGALFNRGEAVWVAEEVAAELVKQGRAELAP